jgi:hypothetical protein
MNTAESFFPTSPQVWLLVTIVLFIDCESSILIILSIYLVFSSQFLWRTAKDQGLFWEFHCPEW